MECKKFKNWDQKDQKCLKEAHKMRWRNHRSKKKSYESWIDEVVKVWRLNSQSATQEVLKIGQKCFERGLD